MERSNYQWSFTERPAAKKHMYDAEERRSRAEMIVAVLEDVAGDLHAFWLLDIACSTGIVAHVFREPFGRVVGIDIDDTAVSYAREHFASESVTFQVGDALKVGFPDEWCDVVVCNQMCEHVPDANALMREIYRVLKLGGLYYFGATNRLKIVETHYGRIPFLSYIPRRLAHLYLRVLGQGRYNYEQLLTYWGFNRITRHFERIDYTEKILDDPLRFRARHIAEKGRNARRVAKVVLGAAYWLSPGYVWVLRKPRHALSEEPDGTRKSRHDLMRVKSCWLRAAWYEGIIE